MDENNKGTVVAEKSPIYVIIQFIATVLCSVAFVSAINQFNKEEEVLLGVGMIVFLLVGIFTLCQGIISLLQPKELIFNYGKGIVVCLAFGRKIDLPFDEITDIVADAHRAKHFFKYSWGDLRIKTQFTTYRIIAVKDVELVAKRLYPKIKHKK